MPEDDEVLYYTPGDICWGIYSGSQYYKESYDKENNYVHNHTLTS